MPGDIVSNLYFLRLLSLIHNGVFKGRLLLFLRTIPSIVDNMKLSVLTIGGAIATVNAAALGERSQFEERATYAVIGKPEGFASGTTGGGSAACAIPSSVAQLKTWLTDSTARCIVLDKE